MHNYSGYNSLPLPLQNYSSPKLYQMIKTPTNYPQTSRSFSLSPSPKQPLFKRQEISFEKIELLRLEIEQKAILCKEKEVEVEFWRKKYEETIGNEGNLDDHLDLLEEYKKKIDMLLAENKKLNEICDKQMKELIFLKDTYMKEDEDPQASPNILYELHELHEENIKLNRENITLKSQSPKEIEAKNEIIKNLIEEKQILKDLLDKNTENVQKMQEKFKILLSDNERLKNLIEEKSSDISFWKDKLSTIEENQEKHIEGLKKQLETNYDKAAKITKQQINYDVETYKLKILELESQNKQLISENQEAKSIISTLNKKYDDLLAKIDDYELNFIEKTIYNEEKSQSNTQIKRLENSLKEILSEHSKLLTIYNEKTEDLNNLMSKYDNLERNHSEHVKQLKKTWEISNNNNIQLSVKESSLRFRNEIESLEMERENLLKYAKTLEEKAQENQEKLINISHKFDNQKKRLLQLEAEKERIEFYQNKIREIENQHMMEIEAIKENLLIEREDQRILDLQEKLEILTEELSKMNRALDEKNEEILFANEKLRTYEEFHDMKMRDFSMKLEGKMQQYRNEKDGYIEDLEKKLEFFQQEKIKYIEEIEKWRGNSLVLEKKLNNIAVIENKLEVMGSQNLVLNKNLSSQMQENMYWKGQVMEQEKLSQYLFEMENKMKYIMAENERLNKIIINRCRDMLNN